MSEDIVKDTLTMIMAGGQGERLFPLTRHRAKPAVPFGGIYRLIDFTLSNCLNSGIKKIIALTQYKSMSLNWHIHRGWNEYFNVELGEFIEVIPPQQRVSKEWYRGTADAIFQNIYSIEMHNPNHVLILSGDHVYKMNYTRMIDFHRKVDADLTIGCVPVDVSESENFGIMEVDSTDKIIGFQEKPKKPKTIPGDKTKALGSMGVYVFNVDSLIQNLTIDAGKITTHDFGRDVIPQMLEKERVYAYRFIDDDTKEPLYWRDVGTIEAYYDANMELVSVSPPFNLYDEEWPLRTYAEQNPPAKTVFADLETNGRVGIALDSIVSNGCIISGGRVERSILGPQTRINSYCDVKDSILMNSVEVGRYAKIKNAIIDKDIKIPRSFKIGYDLERDAKLFFITDSGITVIPKGTVIPERF